MTRDDLRFSGTSGDIDNQEDKILNRLADLLQYYDYYVIPPGEWDLDIPACELHITKNLETILGNNYRKESAPGELTSKSFDDGELTIGELADDFRKHRSQIEDLHNMGPRWIKELENVLRRVGALKSGD